MAMTGLIILASLGFVSIANAASNPFGEAMKRLCDAVCPTGLPQDLAGIIAAIIKAILALVGTIFLILTIYAGILWMTAQGVSEKIEKAKGILTSAVIGLAITMAAYAITYFVTSKLGGI